MSRVILITGTRKGLGKAMALHALAQGDSVVGCSRREGITELEHDRYRHYGGIDVGKENDVVSMVRSVKRDFGRLDGLVCNAGIASMNHLMATPFQTAESVMATNYLGTFVVMREAAKIMARQKFGRMVTLSSVAVPLDLEGEAVYGASKAAVEHLTRVAAREFGPLGITVNGIGPTPIRTDLIRGVPEEKLRALVDRQAIPRFGEERDVLNVLDFFLSEASDFVTGQVVYLGGLHG